MSRDPGGGLNRELYIELLGQPLQATCLAEIHDASMATRDFSMVIDH